MKHKLQKSSKKNTNYEEDYNEVILNDLVNENKEENNAETQEEPVRKTHKKKRINLALGNKKKSTTGEKDNQDTGTLNKKHKSNKEQPKEIIDTDSKADSVEVENNSNQKPSKKNKKSSKSNKEKKSSKKSLHRKKRI